MCQLRPGTFPETKNWKDERVVALIGFADEIAEDLEGQIDLLLKLGVKNGEFRSARRTKVLDLSQEQLKLVKQMLDGAGIAVS